MGLLSTLKYMARHPRLWRVMRALDEIIALVQEIREAVKDKRVTPAEVVAIIDKLEAAIKALRQG